VAAAGDFDPPGQYGRLTTKKVWLCFVSLREAVAGSDCTKRISTVDVRGSHPAELPRASHQRAW